MEERIRSYVDNAIVEALVAAILVGMLVRNLVRVPAEVDAGAAYAAKQLLEGAVLLLSATIDLRQVLAAGPVAVAGSLAFLISLGLGLILSLHIVG